MSDDTTWNDGETLSTPNRPRERQRVSSTAHETVFQMWEGGIRDLHEIELETGYSTSYIRALLKKRGLTVTTINMRSPEDVKGICDDYKSNMKIRSLLRKWKIPNNTLYAILEEQSIPVRRTSESAKAGRRKFLDMAVDMYKEGEPVKEIMTATGLGPAALYQELADRGIPTRTGSDVPDAAVDVAVDMYKNKRTVADIEIESGISGAKLYKALAKRDIPFRRGGDLDTRLDAAVEMYTRGEGVDTIYVETRITSTMLYKRLRRLGLPLRNQVQRKAQGVDIPKALDLYDKGVAYSDILRVAHVSVAELVRALKTRGMNLRTGLAPRVTKRNIDYAVDGYVRGLDADTIEIDTLVGRVVLYAELKKRNIGIRP